jgi:hypothetical protein
MSQATLFDVSPKRSAHCRHCGIEVTDPVGVSFLQCTPCNHREVYEQLIDACRRQWRENPDPEKRRYLEAWANHFKRKRAEIHP